MLKNIFSLTQELLGYEIARGVIIEISIILTNDEKIRFLNRDHRGIDSPTNVLSFPTYERELARCLKYEKYISLGDIVLSIDSIERESIEQNKFFSEQLSLMIVHSLLHLLGFDHGDDAEAEIMETAEAIILHQLSRLPNHRGPHTYK
jgi:probable rRNA maturation factor